MRKKIKRLQTKIWRLKKNALKNEKKRNKGKKDIDIIINQVRTYLPESTTNFIRTQMETSTSLAYQGQDARSFHILSQQESIQDIREIFQPSHKANPFENSAKNKYCARVQL